MMAIPYYRRARYLDDGVSEYQCLLCHETWTMQYGAVNYCPMCGKKVELLDCPTNDDKADRCWRPIDWENPRHERQPSYWQIEKRYAFKWPPATEWDVHPWERWLDLKTDGTSAIRAKAALFWCRTRATERDDDVSRTEYRAVLVPGEPYPLP